MLHHSLITVPIATLPVAFHKNMVAVLGMVEMELGGR
jgi:hypothetical protein